MANIGVAKASIYADLSATKFEKETIKAVERVAKTRTKISSGDQVKFSAMEDTLRLDIAAKSGAIRSMVSAQGYLTATMNALDSGNYILKELHDLAVLAADETKTAEELAALDAGAENLGDEFHKLMTSAQYRGKLIFSDGNADLKVGTGVRNSSINIGAKEVEYDDLYDHINPPLNSISAGITYEIIEPLSEEQKETILARTEGVNIDQLRVGGQFTVISQSANEDGPGLHTNDLYYADDDGTVPFDATSKVSHASNFLGGYLDIEITANSEASDNFGIISGDGSAGTITFNSTTGVVSYVDPNVGAVEIGYVDGVRNGQFDTDNNSGAALKIHFYPDATVPNTSDLANGTFSGGATSWNTYNDRVDFGSTFTVGGVEIPTPSEAIMAEATLVNYDVGVGGVNDPGGRNPPANDDAKVEATFPPVFNVTTGGDATDGAYLNLTNGEFDFERNKTMNFQLAGFSNTGKMEFTLEDFSNTETMEFQLKEFANTTDTFSANLTIDFGSWTKSGDTHTFSDNDPTSSTSLNFTDKTVSEVVDLLEGISGLTAQLNDVNGDGSSYTVQITSENTGFQNGFRISGSGVATDERWTTPSVPTGHAYSYEFSRLASEMFSANLTIDFGSWTESGGTYTFSDDDPTSSISLNFSDKTVSEVVDLIDGISGLTAQLTSNADNSSHTVTITSENAGFKNEFRISGSGAPTDDRWTTPSVPTGSNDFTQLASETFSANLTIDFGSWTESGGTYTFSDNDPASSTSLNFTDKTLSEVIELIEGVSGLTAQLLSNDDDPSLTVQISSENTGFQNGFRISGSGDPTDERWTTPSIPTGHTYSNNFTQLASDWHGSGILHGPAMVSDEFEADEGDILKLRYNAEGDHDWYHVASYIVDTNDDITMALNEFGKTTDDWQYLSVAVPKTDTYRFVFVNGTWDQSNGLRAGASMKIDDVRAEDAYITDENAVQQLLRSTSYSSSSTDQEFVKDVRITANDSSSSITDTSRIFNTEYEGKIMVAPTLNLEKPVSLGASNDLGPDGSTDHYVVVSKIEEVKSRIDTAKAVAQAQHIVLESAIETATDLRSHLFWGADAISDPEFFAETAYFAKQQMMQDSASAILAQANANQGGLMQLVDSPYTIEA